MIPSDFGYILSNGTKALKKPTKNSFKKTKMRKVNVKSQAYLPSVGTGLGRGFVREHGDTQSVLCLPSMCASLGAGQQGTAACGQADSFAGSHLLLRPKSRQKLALWGSCHPAKPLRDTARRMPAKSSMRSHLLHILSHVRGLD